MAKTKYTDLFEKFWQAYPRNVAKPAAFRAWQKQVDEQDAFLPNAVIGDVEKRTRMRWWSADKSKIPHPSTWINQRRWEDEGWEDDIKTRGKENDNKPSSGAVEYTPIEDEYDFNSWQQMQNRMMRNYIWICTMTRRKISHVQLERLIAIKNDTYAETIGAIREEIETADDTRKAKAEMAQMLIETMLNRFDTLMKLDLRERVIDYSHRLHQQRTAA